MNFIKNTESEKSDDELIGHYQSSGDMNFLADLYQRYMELVYGVCLKYLKNEEDAKDAVINIYEELIAKIKKHQINHFKSWLYQLSKNHCLMILRKKKIIYLNPDTENMQLSDNLHLDEVMLKENQLNKLHKCIEELTDEQKLAITLFYLEKKCYKEIASVSKIDSSKIKSFIQNGRRNLKICMDKQK